MAGHSSVLARTKPWLGIEWDFASGLLLILVLASGCAKQQASPAPRPAIPVVVAKVSQKAMPVQLTAIGNVEAYATITVKAQVAGELLDVYFKEGDFVKKGQLLFKIDPRPYEAALAQAQATLAHDKAVAINARAQAQRYLTLRADGVVAASDADTYTSAADASDATVAADEAAIQTAQLNIEYCTIFSPIDGRTGAVTVKPGNLVPGLAGGAANSAIVVINQVVPIFVNFTVPQQYLSDIKRYMAAGALRVESVVPNDPGPPEVGSLIFVDNAVDPTTGTIHLRGIFTNEKNRLWPGLYVNTLMTLSEQANATVVPAQALTAGQQGTFVYVLKDDGTVTPRPVVSSRTIQGEAVIDKGLQPGETVVTDGQVRLVPGSKVQIKNSSSEAEEDAAGSRAGPGPP